MRKNNCLYLRVSLLNQKHVLIYNIQLLPCTAVALSLPLILMGLVRLRFRHDEQCDPLLICLQRCVSLKCLLTVPVPDHFAPQAMLTPSTPCHAKKTATPQRSVLRYAEVCDLGGCLIGLMVALSLSSRSQMPTVSLRQDILIRSGCTSRMSNGVIEEQVMPVFTHCNRLLTLIDCISLIMGCKYIAIMDCKGSDKCNLFFVCNEFIYPAHNR